MPNRNSRRKCRGIGQQVHQKVHDDAEQAQQQQRQLEQIDQLDHLFRDLGVTANLDPSNSLPSRAPRQHNMVQGDGSTEWTNTMVLRETPKSYAAAPNNIPTPTLNGNGTPNRNEIRSPHLNLTIPQPTGTTSQINKVQFSNPNVSDTSQELSTRKTTQIVPATPLIQTRNNRGNVFDTSNSPASSQLLAIDHPCPIPWTNYTTRNPSRKTLAYGSTRLGLGTRSSTLECVQQLSTTPFRPTSPTLDRIHELRRAENGIKNNASTQPSGRSDRAQATPLYDQNIRAEQMKTNLSTESSKTVPLNPSAASFALTLGRKADSDNIPHLPLENDVVEDGIVTIEQEVLIPGDEADEFEIIENVSVVESEDNRAQRRWWKVYRR